MKQVPLADDAPDALRGKSIQSCVYEKPSFSASTPGKTMLIGGLLGSALSVRKGNEIVNSNSVADPAPSIAAGISDILVKKYGLNLSGGSGAIAESDGIVKLVDLYDDTDFLVDVKTTHWSLTYFPGDWNNYRIVYRARMRIIETEPGKVLASGDCKYLPEYEDTSTAPTYSKLVDNGAQGLKSELEKASDFCTEQFAKTLSGN